MADNTILSAAVGTGDTIRTDDVGGSVKIPVSKIALGGDGTDSGFMASGAGAVSATVPRVTLASDDPAVASLQTLDNIVSGNEAQVDVITLPALPAGTNNIGDVDIASIAAGDNNIGNVDIVSMPSITGTVTANAGTNLNTSALALESGGNLAASAGFLDTIQGETVTQTSTLGNIQTAVEKIDNPVFVDDAAFTVGTSSVMMAGGTVDEASTDSADEGDAAALRVSANRQLIITQRPNASGEGLDIFRSIDLDETEEDVKTSAGKVYGWFLFNLAASVRYVKFYNATAANVTVGSTTPVLTFPLPAGSGANVEFANGIPFSTAISVAATTGVADSDTGAPSANDVVANILFK